jgi:hypothetical protein
MKDDLDWRPTDEELATIQREADEQERAVDAAFPNVAHVRARIKKLHATNPLKAIDLIFRLEELLGQNMHEFVHWPLPSWKAIRNRTAYLYD